MPDTGFKFPGTMVGNRTITGSDADWTNADNCKADDGSVASVTLTGAGDISSGLAASNFDFSVVPDDAWIDGIEIRCGDYLVDTTIGDPRWTSVRLILADNSDGTEAKFLELNVWTPSNQTDEAGSSTDFWGEILKGTDVKDADFGFFVASRIIDGPFSTIFDIDFLQMRIFYHVGLPSIVIVAPGIPGYHPPWKSTGGNFYLVVRDTIDDIFDVYKATNPASDTWVAQDTGNHPDIASTFTRLSVAKDGDVLHMGSWQGTAYIYHQFNMATDTWSVTQETIEGPAQTPELEWISMAVRSTGIPVAVYNGDTDRVMGGAKERVDVNVRTGGTWDGAVALDAAGDIHYGNPNVVKGPLTDDMHILWQQTTNTADPPTSWAASCQGRTLRPDNSLSTVDTTGGGSTGDGLLGFPNMVSYDDGGTQRMILNGWTTATSNTIRTVQCTEDGADDIQIDANPIESFISNPGFTNGEVGINSLVEFNNDLHWLYSGGGVIGTEQDLFYSTSINEGTDWTTEVEELDGVTVNFISATIYTRGFEIVLAYLYDDGGVQKYNEKVLSTNPAQLLQKNIPILRTQL